MPVIDRCHNVEDMRQAARARVPKGLFEYVDRGSEDEVALRDNRGAFERVKLKTRFMVDLRRRDLGTRLFGKRVELPLVIAPTGLAGLLCPHGELAMARATAKAGIPTSVTFGAVTSMERIASESTGQLWFQIYMWPQQELVHEMVKRARDLGRYDALIITIDTALGRTREHNLRNGFTVPVEFNRKMVLDMALHPGWLMRVMLPYLMNGGMPIHANYPPQFKRVVARFRGKGGGEPQRHEGMVWDDIRTLRGMWPGKLIVKGILSEGDAVRAVDCGADGIVISNHGGRAMDSAVPTITILPSIAAAVNGRCTILLDSGVRRGSDIVKALALGAHGVMIGRATLYGLAAGGQAGAEKTIAILRNEFEKTMGYVGARSVDELGPHILASSLT
jgi:isopentenyl diphosphate isomerase/L-lactate dehydrogenase-like FMN-dependent dehydrogenase